MTLRMLAVLWISFSLTSCATTRAPSLKMLEKRADYEGLSQINSTFVESNQKTAQGPVRTHSAVADIRVHAHEMPNGDYFMGGWIRTVIEKPKWQSAQHPPPPTSIFKDADKANAEKKKN